MLMRYAVELARSTFKRSAILLLPIVIAAVLALPHAYASSSTGGDAVLDMFSAQVLLEKRSALDSARQVGGSEDLVTALENEVSALEDALAAKDNKTFFMAAAQYFQEEVRIDELGFFESSPYTPELRANAQTIFGLAELDDPVVYKTIADEPTAYYLAANLNTAPQIIWLVPALVLSVALIRNRSDWRLLAQAPIPRSSQATASVLMQRSELWQPSYWLAFPLGPLPTAMPDLETSLILVRLFRAVSSSVRLSALCLCIA